MGEREGGEDLGDVVDRHGDLDSPAAQHLFQADAFDQLQNHDQAVIDAQGGVECGDVGMLEAGVNFDLTEEAVGESGILIEVGKDDFHGLLATRKHAAHAKDLAHAAATQNASDLIIAEDIADLNSHLFDSNANLQMIRRPKLSLAAHLGHLASCRVYKRSATALANAAGLFLRGRDVRHWK